MRNHVMSTTCALLTLSVFIAEAGPAHAATPSQITIQGKLTDAGGSPLLPGPKSFVFRIFDALSGGTQVWPLAGPGGEPQTITTGADGLWIGLVGAVSPLNDAVFSDTVRWLEITVDGTTLPRTRLAANSYSFRVATVDGASGGTITSKVSIGPGHTNTGDNAFVAGENNTAGGDRAAIGGGTGNDAAGQFSVVGGGAQNATGAIGATVAGGLENIASAPAATVAGGEENRATGDQSVVAGGALNIASGLMSSVGGGLQDSALGGRSVVGGGEANVASGDWSTVAGGYRNIANGGASTVGGGWLNVSTGNSSHVGGGLQDSALGYRSTVGGGEANVASGEWSTVGGGGANYATNYVATIAGGNRSIASGHGSTVGGGEFNRARGINSTVSGGGGPVLADSNNASGDISTVSGGRRNTASGYGSTIGGGGFNLAASNWATVSGGYNSISSNEFSTVGGGYEDTASGSRATVAGGQWNVASGDWSTVGGGGANYASNFVATVAGGNRNIASGQGSTVGGGEFDTVAGNYATVPGGSGNAAAGHYSLAAGLRAKALHSGAFVWADSSNSDFASTAQDQFLIRASGGVGVGTNAPEAPLHISEGSAGATTAYVNAVAAFERNGNAYLQLLSPDANENGLLFGTPAANLGGAVLFNTGSVPNGLEFRTNTNDFTVAINAAGQVGINTTAPYTNLSVDGTIGFKNGSAVEMYIFESGTANADRMIIAHSPSAPNYGLEYQDVGDKFAFVGNGFPAMTVDLSGTGGFVGFGSITAPSNVITVPDIAGVGGRGLADRWDVYSSRRWKDSVKTISEPLALVSQLRGVRYLDKASGTPDIGLIAEEVGEVFPEIVQYETNGVDARSLDYARLVAVLIEAVKEQQEQIDELRKCLDRQAP